MDCIWQCRKTTECIDTGMTLTSCDYRTCLLYGSTACANEILLLYMMTCLHVGTEYEVSLLSDVRFVLDADHARGDVHFREVDARTRQSIKTIFFETTMNLRYMNGRKFMSKYWKINALGCWWSHSFCRKHRSALRPKHFSENVFCCVCWLLCSRSPMMTFIDDDHSVTFRVKW